MRGGSLWGASLGALVGYGAAVLIASLPRPHYAPRLVAWSFTPIDGEPAIRWYGTLLWALAGALLGLAGGRFLRGRPPWVALSLIAAAAWLLLAWGERGWFRG